jgi:hypothetical protein
MNYKRAIREALLLFPPELIVCNPHRPATEVAKSSNLAEAWERSEELTKNSSVWHQLAVWAAGCALHRLVREEGAKGVQTIPKSMIDRKYAEFKFAESLLTTNTWFPRHIKRAYRRDRALRGLTRFPESQPKYEQRISQNNGAFNNE